VYNFKHFPVENLGLMSIGAELGQYILQTHSIQKKIMKTHWVFPNLPSVHANDHCHNVDKKTENNKDYRST